MSMAISRSTSCYSECNASVEVAPNSPFQLGMSNPSTCDGDTRQVIDKSSISLSCGHT